MNEYHIMYLALGYDERLAPKNKIRSLSVRPSEYRNRNTGIYIYIYIPLCHMARTMRDAALQLECLIWRLKSSSNYN